MTVVAVAAPTAWSVGLTASAFCVVGALKARTVELAPIRTALRTLAVGGTAATLAFLVGFLLRDLA